MHFYHYTVFTLAIILSSAGLYLLMGRPLSKDRKINNYVVAKRFAAIGFLVWSIQCFVLGSTDIRLQSKHFAVAMNITSYFFATFCLYMAFLRLLNITLKRKRIIQNILLFLFVNLVTWTGTLLIGTHRMFSKILLMVGGITLFAYMIGISFNFIRVYRKLKREIDSYSYENISAFTSWMYKAVICSIVMGILAVPVSFLHIAYSSLISIFAIVLVMYIFFSFIEYLVNYATVSTILNELYSENDEDGPDESTVKEGNLEGDNLEDERLKTLFDKWASEDNYLLEGVTVDSLVRNFNTNRTYFSTFFNRTYRTTFRNWINTKRIDYAQSYMLAHPECTVNTLSQLTGYQSRTHFIKVFSQQTGMTPSHFKEEYCQ